MSLLRVQGPGGELKLDSRVPLRDISMVKRERPDSTADFSFRVATPSATVTLPSTRAVADAVETQACVSPPAGAHRLSERRGVPLLAGGPDAVHVYVVPRR